MTRSARRRLVAFAAGLTLAVGALGGLVAQMVHPQIPSLSLIEARIGWWVTVLLLVVLVLLYVALPVAAAAILAREDGHPRAYAVVALAAVLGPVVVPVGVGRAIERAPIRPGGFFILGVAIGAFVIFLVGAVVAIERTTRTIPGTGWVFALNLAVVLLFFCGLVGVQLAAPGFAEEHTSEYDSFGYVPDAGFEFKERTTDDGRVVVARHSGGDPVAADDLRLIGEGFADVGGADRTAPGPWSGNASGEFPRRDKPTVVEGDATTVGVTDDCKVRVVFSANPDHSDTVGYYECSES